MSKLSAQVILTAVVQAVQGAGGSSVFLSDRDVYSMASIQPAIANVFDLMGVIFMQQTGANTLIEFLHVMESHT